MNTDKIYAESVVNDYAPKRTSKVMALKKLDAKAKRPSDIFAFTFGIISSLVFGTGLCFAMQVIGNGVALSVLGIVIGIVGMVGCGINYPLYKKLRQNGKDKYASDIIRLAKEIAEEK